MRPTAARWRRLAIAGLGALGLSAAFAGALSAHPLGNFTINHYAGLRVSPTALAVDFVLDMAEIPTFQERQRIDLNADGTVDPVEIEAERLVACPRIARELSLAASGVALPLTPTAAGLTFPLGSSGLETMRLVCEFSAPLPAPITAPTTITYADGTWSQRIGWREIVASGDGVTIAGAVAASVSQRLTTYPQDLLAQPLSMLSATLSVTPGGAAAAPFVAPDARPLPGVAIPSAAVASLPIGSAPAASLPIGSAPPASAGSSAAPVGSSPVASAAAATAPIASAAPSPSARVRQIGAIPGGAAEQISQLLEVKDLTPLAVIGSLLVAAFLGGLHAVSPGHGKTVMAAYLVGSRGSARHAVALGLTVTVSHTAGVLILAMVTLFASNIIPPEWLYPVLGLLSGVLVIGIGLWLLYGRYRIWARTRADARSHDARLLEHGLAHGPDEPHQHPHRGDRDIEGSVAVRRYGGGSAMAAGGASGASTGAFAAQRDGRATGDRGHGGPGSDDHGHDHPAATGEHSHGGIRHSHLPRSGADLTWRSLFSLGLAGGLVPSASALLLLLGSLAANRPAYGVVLVIAFGAGMAVVLAGVGLLLVYATRFVERVPTGTLGRRLWDVLPVATAIVVIGAGIYLTSQAVTQVF